MWNDTLVLILPFSDNSSLTLMLVTVAVVALSSSLFEPCINHISTFIIYGVKLIIVKSVFSSKGVMSFSACLEKEIYILFIKKQMWGKKITTTKKQKTNCRNAEVAQMSQFYSHTWMQLKFLDLRKVCDVKFVSHVHAMWSVHIRWLVNRNPTSGITGQPLFSWLQGGCHLILASYDWYDFSW